MTPDLRVPMARRTAVRSSTGDDAVPEHCLRVPKPMQKEPAGWSTAAGAADEGEDARGGWPEATRPSRLLVPGRRGARSCGRPTPTLRSYLTVRVFEAVLAAGPDAMTALTVKV